VAEALREVVCNGQSACAAGSSEAGLETLKTHRWDGKEEGESPRLSLACQESQVRYSLSQKSASVGPRAKFQQEVEYLPEQSSLLVCPVHHNWLRSIQVGGWAAGWRVTT
jgi:hypothetical protein